MTGDREGMRSAGAMFRTAFPDWRSDRHRLVAEDELNSLLLDAHGLTPAQQRVTEQLLRGHSTRQIVDELHISAYTVQEHLRAAFDKFGVGSRRELIAALTQPR
jgi:DNA-binding CsgD family transcriptional regulator